jgi:hypothetical protein
VDADTPVVLKARTLLVLPLHAALVEQLPHDQVGETITIEYGGEVPRPGTRVDGRPGTATARVHGRAQGGGRRDGGRALILLRPWTPPRCPRCRVRLITARDRALACPRPGHRGAKGQLLLAV